MNTFQNRTETAGLGRKKTVCLLALALFAGCGGGSHGSGSGPDPVADSFVLAGEITPGVGSAFGGTLVSIIGSGFVVDIEGPTLVTFGGVDASDVLVIDDSTLTCVTPPGTPGTSAEVRVENSAGTFVLSSSFGYLEVPDITSDLNGDGVADVVVGAPRDGTLESSAGAVFVFFGSDQGSAMGDRNTTEADLTVRGEQERCLFGSTLTTGDVDGDGQDDLVVAANFDDSANVDSGAVYIFLGPLTGGELRSSEADIILLGDARVAGDRFGSSLALGDIDGDGAADLAIGAPRHDTGADAPAAELDAGAVYVFLSVGSLTSTTAEFADLQFDGEEAGSRLGNSVLIADLGGDGTEDLIMASSVHDPVHPPKTRDAGAVYVFMSSDSLESANARSADVVLYGTAIGDEFGHSLGAGDLSGDGTDDLLVGVPRQDSLGLDVGRVYVFLGGAELESGRAESADVFLDGQPTNDAFGMDLSAADVNGDGIDDILVGAKDASFGADGNGRAYLFLGGESFGPAVATGADVIFTGEANNGDAFGECTKLVDRNLDGLADVIAGAPRNAVSASGAGRVYVFDGGQGMTDRNADGDDWTLTGMTVGGLFGASMADGE